MQSKVVHTILIILLSLFATWADGKNNIYCSVTQGETTSHPWFVTSCIHWLRFKQIVTYELCVLVFKYLISLVPRYLGAPDMADYVMARRLRSADNCCVERQRTRLKFGEREFSATAPEAWNSLPVHEKPVSTWGLFGDGHKTELFLISYPWQYLSVIVWPFDFWMHGSQLSKWHPVIRQFCLFLLAGCLFWHNSWKCWPALCPGVSTSDCYL